MLIVQERTFIELFLFSFNYIAALFNTEIIMLGWIRNNKYREWFYITTITILMFSIIVILLFNNNDTSIGEIFLTLSSILLVIITIVCNHINRKRDSFSQLFNTQISLFNHYFNTSTTKRTITLDNFNKIHLTLSEDKTYKVIKSSPITKNFCEYFKANINEVGYRELSSNEIIEIWNVFCNSLKYRSEFEYSFKCIFMCIRTVKKEDYLTENEKKEIYGNNK